MLIKKKYKRAEVEELLAQKEREYIEKIGELKEKTEILSKENSELSSRLSGYKDKDALINSSIKAAEEKAAETEKKIAVKYRLEEEKLKTFSSRFDGYFNDLTQKYPHYQAIKDAADIFENLKKILEGEGSSEEKIKKTEKLLPKKSSGKKAAPFNPKEKIDAYIAATGDNGFNLDEVLNPGELRLEDICRELGLTEEE